MTTTAPTEFLLYASMRDKVSCMLFYISRESDDQTIVYQATRKENELVGDYVTIFKTNISHAIDNFKQRASLSGILSRFFGMKVTRDDKNVYNAILTYLPSRPLRLRLKKQEDRVTATTTLFTSWEGKRL